MLGVEAGFAAKTISRLRRIPTQKGQDGVESLCLWACTLGTGQCCHKGRDMSTDFSQQQQQQQPGASTARNPLAGHLPTHRKTLRMRPDCSRFCPAKRRRAEFLQKVAGIIEKRKVQKRRLAWSGDAPRPIPKTRKDVERELKRACPLDAVRLWFTRWIRT